MSSSRSFKGFYMFLAWVFTLVSSVLLGFWLATMLVNGEFSGALGGFSLLFGFGAAAMWTIYLGEASYAAKVKYYDHGTQSIRLARSRAH